MDCSRASEMTLVLTNSLVSPDAQITVEGPKPKRPRLITEIEFIYVDSKSERFYNEPDNTPSCPATRRSR
jgi:hypothetical protein